MLNSFTNPLYSLLPLPFLEDISFLRDIGLVVDSSTDQTTSDNSENEISDDESLNDKAGLNLLHCCRVSGIRPIKKRRTTFERRLKTESPWWSTFLTPEKRELYHQFPDGRDATLFRRIFKVPYSLFKEKIFNFAVETWWNDWHDEKVDAFNFPVSNLELKLLGCLCTLATATCHLLVSIQTNISETVHRKFFNEWLEKMSSFNGVQADYALIGLPGCVGSVDCVHIGWGKCPHQYYNMYKGKEGYPTISFEVIYTSQKFIQYVTKGHPGTRNEKHIVRFDTSVTDLLNPMSFLGSQSFVLNDANGEKQRFTGSYLICDGGYHCCPCLMFPVKTGIPESPPMKWAARIESIRKDIETVFGILKRQFCYLKSFPEVKKHESLEAAFVTCCILHNLLLEHDGFLSEDLTNIQNGVRDYLECIHLLDLI